jgi:AraC-like DNA-binding protein
MNSSFSPIPSNPVYFRSTAPAPPLRPFITPYRFFRSYGYLHTPLIIPSIPDGTIEMYLHWGDVPQFYSQGRVCSPVQSESSIQGTHMRGFVAHLGGIVDGINISFRPGGFFALFGINAHLLAAQHVPLEDVLGPAFMTSFASMRFLPDKARLDWLDTLLMRQLHQHKFIDIAPEVLQAVALSTQYPHRLTVSALARACAVSPSTLHRLFHRHVGLSPKRYLRLQRLWMAIRLWKASRLSLADLALQAGYFDQSHFANEMSNVMDLSFHDFKELLRQQDARFFQDTEAT